MSLDAFVFCDCFENDSLRCNPPREVKVIVTPAGDLSCDSKDENLWLAFREWKQTKACVHPGMVLVHQRLGDTALIDYLRSELEKQPKRFPILRTNVLYSGTHTCDWIPVDRLPQLTRELKDLIPEEFQGRAADAFRIFKIQMAELVIAAQHADKPICF